MTVLSLSDAKDYLKETTTELDAPSLLPQTILAAVRAVEQDVGLIEARTVTERLDGDSLVLSTLPVLSLTSITPTVSGGPVSLTGHHVDALSGVVIWAAGSPLSGGAYDVVYRAGRVEPLAQDPDANAPEVVTPIDDDLLLAVKVKLRILAAAYRRGKGGGQPDPGAVDLYRMLVRGHRLPGFA